MLLGSTSIPALPLSSFHIPCVQVPTLRIQSVVLHQRSTSLDTPVLQTWGGKKSSFRGVMGGTRPACHATSLDIDSVLWYTCSVGTSQHKGTPLHDEKLFVIGGYPDRSDCSHASLGMRANALYTSPTCVPLAMWGGALDAQSVGWQMSPVLTAPVPQVVGGQCSGPCASVSKGLVTSPCL